MRKSGDRAGRELGERDVRQQLGAGNHGIQGGARNALPLVDSERERPEVSKRIAQRVAAWAA